MATIDSITERDLYPLLDLTADGVAVVAPDPWRFVYANPAFVEWLGHPAGGVQNRDAATILDESLHLRLLPHIERLWHSEATDGEAIVEFEAGECGPAENSVVLRRIEVAEGPAIGLIVKRRASSAQAAPQGHRDALTGLPGREFLFARLSMHLQGERSADVKFAVLFIDLNNFKQVNDEYGHLIGDRVLSEAARRLSETVREGDHVVRYGGDEFVVLLEGVAGADEVDPIIHRLHEALAQPIILPEGEVTLSLSIGVAEASAIHQTPEDVLQEADRAMYAAKRTGTKAWRLLPAK
jgi:diguanylate cyclase (GGDEF)-like protein